jgi:exopolysaccharide biosynthesis polyprenyl glycosylphosphotransferase
MTMSTVDQLEPLEEQNVRLVPGTGSERPGRTRPRRPRQDEIYKRVLVGTDLLCGLAALITVRAVAGGRLLQWDLLTALVVVALASVMGRYDAHHAVMRRSVLDEAPSLVVLAAVWALLWSLLSIALHVHTGVGRGGTGVLWLALAGLLVLSRGCVQAVGVRLRGPERILIIGGSQARGTMSHSLSTDPGARIHIVGCLPLEDERLSSVGVPEGIGRDRRGVRWSFDDLPEVVSKLKVERVLLIPTATDGDLTITAVQRITDLNLRVSLVPRLFEVVGSAVEFDNVAGLTVLGMRRPGLTQSSRLIKRGIDLAGAGIALALASPVLLAAAVTIKLDSSGPILFRQPRVGRDGRLFEILKFRSMVDGAEAQREALAHRNETQGLFKLAEDPRVTRIGRLLRRTSIDELPQIINVLRGDMSLVGPRPLILSEDTLIVGRQRRRLEMSPGMTGPWQILGPTRPPLAEMVKADYLYAINWSLWLDVKILLRTVSHVRAGRGR